MKRLFLFLGCTFVGCTLERDSFNKEMKELTCEKYEICETSAAEMFGFANFNQCFELLSEIEEENKNEDCEFNASNAKACLDQFRSQACDRFLYDGFPAVCEILYDCNEDADEPDEEESMQD